METRYELLQVPFSTADAELPEVSFEGGSLRVTFRDWREHTVSVLFRDVAAFSWDAGDAAVDSGRRDDCCYMVINSPWLRRHMHVGSVTPADGVQHYKLCFNAAGVLQVLASKLEVIG